MTIDVSAQYAAFKDTAPRATAPAMDEMQGSDILAIAAEVRALREQGRAVHNLTIGDFDPAVFPIPTALSERIHKALDDGHTNYPPAVGVPELRKAITTLYRRELGLDFPVESVLVGSGARPPLYAAVKCLTADGDNVIYPVPSWNMNHYVWLSRGHGVPIVTSPDTGFMPTAAQLRPHLSTARIVLINSPQNPSGTLITEDVLGEVCDAILEENARRRAVNERPLFLLYDAVYWQLTFGESRHHTPINLRPEMAPYTVMIDAISKCWSATGLRVGWCVSPPWVRDKMQQLIGHMGAWAGRAEQIATAALLEDPSLLGTYMADFKQEIRFRLDGLQDGVESMARDGLPVSCLPAAGAIYLSVRFDLIGRTLANGTTLRTDSDLRKWLLHEAGVAVVPFSSFGYPDGSGWVRMSVGSITRQDVAKTVAALREALSRAL